MRGANGKKGQGFDPRWEGRVGRACHARWDEEKTERKAKERSNKLDRGRCEEADETDENQFDGIQQARADPETNEIKHTQFLSEKLTVRNADGQPLDAKDLLKKYGAAYIVSSLSLSLVSFSFFYVLFSSSVDTGKLIEMTHLKLDERAEKASTAALAYAAHKAASPLRFPPTVALTPAVAKLMGRQDENEDETPGA